jgi:hypothetical protein
MAAPNIRKVTVVRNKLPLVTRSPNSRKGFTAKDAKKTVKKIVK